MDNQQTIKFYAIPQYSIKIQERRYGLLFDYKLKY